MRALNLLHRAARSIVLRGISRWDGSALQVELPDGARHSFGPAGADRRLGIRVRHNRFFTRLLFGGATGAGEAYVAGDWESDELQAVLHEGLRNSDRIKLDSVAAVPAALRNAWRHRRRANTREGSARNIHDHYDLGNQFFATFLDPTLTYSCAVWEAGDDLEGAQRRKYQAVCDKLAVNADDHVLDIGCGWGGFAIHAAQTTGCRVTAVTISREQHKLARRRVHEHGLGDRIDVQYCDYRNLDGTFDKIVSIEMFEAVGREYWTAFFQACRRTLRRGGSMLLQTIAIPDSRVHSARRASGWISRYVFPGGVLPAVVEIEQSVGAASEALVIRDVDEIGTQYVRTLDEWRQRFWASIDRVRALGFDERFVRMWDFYLAACSAAFEARQIRDVQVLIDHRATATPSPG